MCAALRVLNMCVRGAIYACGPLYVSMRFLRECVYECVEAILMCAPVSLWFGVCARSVKSLSSAAQN